MFSFFPYKAARKRPFGAAVSVLFLLLGLGAGVALNAYHDALLREREEKAHRMVDTAFNLISYYYGKAQKGEMPEDKARHYALETIKYASLDTNGYFWVIDTHPRGIMHPIQPNWEGADLSDYKDSSGKRLFLDMVELVKAKNEGFIDYFWTKPNAHENKTYAKVSYIKLFKPWDWIIGTGVYLDDVNASFWNAVLFVCGLSLAVLMFVMALAITVSENFKRALS